MQLTMKVGAGIYRHVWLNKTARLHVKRFGTYITTPEISADKAVVSMKTVVQNETKVPRSFTLVSKIIIDNGTVLNTQTSTCTIEAGGETEIIQKDIVQKPLLWSPETPHLYKVITEIVENRKPVDDYETTFGIRTVEITNQGFFLNGKLYPVKRNSQPPGFCRSRCSTAG